LGNANLERGLGDVLRALDEGEGKVATLGEVAEAGTAVPVAVVEAVGI